MSTDNTSTRSRRRERTRTRILDAARALILTKGHENLSLREIARQVDYSPAGLYEYFSSKEAILAALSQRAQSRLYRAMANATKVEDTPPLVALGLTYIAYARSHKEDFLLLFSRTSSTRQSTNEVPAARSPYLLVLESVRALIERGHIDTDVVSRIGAEGIAYSLWGFAHGLATLQITHLEGFNSDFATADRVALERFVHGLAP